MHLHKFAQPACLAGAAIWIAFLPRPASGQSATMGGLAGTVVSSDGAAIADATVHLLQETSGQEQTTTTASNGRYAFSLLAPGPYEVRFAAHGFQKARMPR